MKLADYKGESEAPNSKMAKQFSMHGHQRSEITHQIGNLETQNGQNEWSHFLKRQHLHFQTIYKYKFIV